MEITRERAWETLTRHTKSEALLRHALAVEASVRAYARKFGEDEELWGVTALLHDFDWEMHPTLDQHPQDGAPILREEGYPEEVIEGILLKRSASARRKAGLVNLREAQSGVGYAGPLPRPNAEEEEQWIADTLYAEKHGSQPKRPQS